MVGNKESKTLAAGQDEAGGPDEGFLPPDRRKNLGMSKRRG